MAEAVAFVGVVASFFQLVECGTKLADRINEFSSALEEVPESLRTISAQLPLAIATIRNLQQQVKEGYFPSRDVKALEAVVDRCIELIQGINAVLEKIIPRNASSNWEKRLQAIRSLKYDKKIHSSSNQLLQSINMLIFHQNTHQHDLTTQLSEAFVEASISPKSTGFFASFGLNLGSAPQLADNFFVGRKAELKQLADWLDPASQRQNIAAVVGMGGMGKTQLCIEYAISQQYRYSAIFWLQAKDETSLRADLARVAQIVLADQKHDGEEASEAGLIKKFLRWTSLPENKNWLLIFDNLDNPSTPGRKDPTAYDIRKYFPDRAQGSILITSRSRQLTYAKQLRLQKLEAIEQALEILNVRAGQDFQDDPDVISLVKRLDGLPLALATAGALLGRTNCSVKEYLEDYEQDWEDGEDIDELLEYSDRTLFTTWNLSYEKIKDMDLEAAEVLRILAFFGNENIDYKLLVPDDTVRWSTAKQSLQSRRHFNRAMARLHDFSLTENVQGGYRLHPCVHDWTLSRLNRNLDTSDLWCTLECLRADAQEVFSATYNVWRARIRSHSLRLAHPRLMKCLLTDSLNQEQAQALISLTAYLTEGGNHTEAERVGSFVLGWLEKHLGKTHQETLNQTNVIAGVYKSLGQEDKAESTYKKAIEGYLWTVGWCDCSTLDPVHNLAILYKSQDRLDEALHLYKWSMKGCEISYGMNDPNTFWAAWALGQVYLAQGNYGEAETEYFRALKGFEDTGVGRDHSFMRGARKELGDIYWNQGDWEKAEEMYRRAYESCCRELGVQDEETTRVAQELYCALRILGRENDEKELRAKHEIDDEYIDYYTKNHMKAEEEKSDSDADTACEDITGGAGDDQSEDPLKST